MKGREPWLGLVSIAGLVTMLLGERWVDVVGFALVVTPLVYGGVSWVRARRRES